MINPGRVGPPRDRDPLRKQLEISGEVENKSFAEAKSGLSASKMDKPDNKKSAPQGSAFCV